MFMSGYGNEKDSFALPPGDAERRQNAFLSLGCNSCRHLPVEQIFGLVATLPTLCA